MLVPQHLRVATGKKQYKKLGEETGTAFETPKPSNVRVGGDSSPQANH